MRTRCSCFQNSYFFCHVTGQQAILSSVVYSGSLRDTLHPYRDLNVVRSSVNIWGWMDGWMDGWMSGWMDGWMDGWMSWWMDGWMDELVDGWMNGWMDEWEDG